VRLFLQNDVEKKKEQQEVTPGVQLNRDAFTPARVSGSTEVLQWLPVYHSRSHVAVAKCR
jgi:hypothetical protein